MKAVRPTLLHGDTACYLRRLPNTLSLDDRAHPQALSEVARSIEVLGWGTDMVVACGGVLSEEKAAALSAERWLPVSDESSAGLRAPMEHTLADVRNRHDGFLKRVSPDGAFMLRRKRPSRINPNPHIVRLAGSGIATIKNSEGDRARSETRSSSMKPL
jgi:hypothetical protein